MKTVIEGKRILITGGTGSFGNRVASFLAELNPCEIVIFSRDEKKQWEMERRFPNFRYIVGDVRDKDRLLEGMKKIDLVFHAAALKQVPSCENNPFEAVKTNILGSNNMCEVARDQEVEVVVALSTDKAVKPVNTMGISKACMEKIVTSQNRLPLGTKFCCTRYGNVMGSRGSVIPMFRHLIENREMLTITDPRMTRFLMTLDESVDLVVHAMTYAQGGEIFVRKAPAARVIDLAQAMIKKYGDGDLERIAVIGIRPGEKLDEVLVNEYEMTRAKENDEYFTILPEYRQLPVDNSYEFGTEYTSANTEVISDHDEIGMMLDRVGRTEYYT
jgi:FlaA1/EpsC-like NDP-sugar epimerase